MIFKTWKNNEALFYMEEQTQRKYREEKWRQEVWVEIKMWIVLNQDLGDQRLFLF